MACVAASARVVAGSRRWTAVHGLKADYCVRRSASKVSSLLRWDQLEEFARKVAVVDVHGDHTFEDLFCRSEALARRLPDNRSTNGHASILCPNDSTYVTALLACWMSGFSAVPLSHVQPPSQWEFVVRDSRSSVVVSVGGAVDDRLRSLCAGLDVPCHEFGTDDVLGNCERVAGVNVVRKVTRNSNALLLYSSGTAVDLPKGVVVTHGMLQSQVSSMVQAWKMCKSDVVLHTLPLHHVHGLVTALLCPLSCGGTVNMLPELDTSQIWEQLTCARNDSTRVNVFMAVPAIYERLLEHYDDKFQTKTIVREFIRASCEHNIRLMVSGSASLTEQTFKRWEEITGHKLLERYGTTEIGTALTSPLNGPRNPGFVGAPFPKVEVCIAKPNIYARLGYNVVNTVNGGAPATIATNTESESGELYIRGPGVFQEYWNRPEDTKNAFTIDGWFKTGDTAQYVDGSYKILGRTSVDIIKSGGFKISALDVERHLLEHEHVRQCAVVGLPDIVWGQKVAAVVVPNADGGLALEQLRDWCRKRLPPYCVPTVVKLVSEIPRNVMGKVDKKGLIKELFS